MEARWLLDPLRTHELSTALIRARPDADRRLFMVLLCYCCCVRAGVLAACGWDAAAVLHTGRLSGSECVGFGCVCCGARCERGRATATDTPQVKPVTGGGTKAARTAHHRSKPAQQEREETGQQVYYHTAVLAHVHHTAPTRPAHTPTPAHSTTPHA